MIRKKKSTKKKSFKTIDKKLCENNFKLTKKALKNFKYYKKATKFSKISEKHVNILKTLTREILLKFWIVNYKIIYKFQKQEYLWC